MSRHRQETALRPAEPGVLARLMTRRSPQEKKRLSYLKDRRNLYGENDKASRKNIPRSRKQKHRAERHRVGGGIRKSLQDSTAGPDRADIDEDALERRLAGRRSSRWRKRADRPLGETVEFRLGRRTTRGNAAPEQAEKRIRRIRRRLR
jgi:hypothetical protein